MEICRKKQAKKQKQNAKVERLSKAEYFTKKITDKLAGDATKDKEVDGEKSKGDKPKGDAKKGKKDKKPKNRGPSNRSQSHRTSEKKRKQKAK